MSLVLKHNYVMWLRKYHWQWFCTLTFRPGIRHKTGVRLFREWIGVLEADARARLSWVRMAEYGGELGKLHFHVLIAGVRRVPARRAESIWKQLAGTAVIGIYDPQQRGLEYALKSIEDGPDYDFDAELRSEHRQRRPERTRRGGPKSLNSEEPTRVRGGPIRHGLGQ